MSNKIVTIVGARPQFIKAATVSRLFKKDERFSEVIVHTGQHHDHIMSDIFFDELNIPKPSYQLDINGVSHGQMTGRMLVGIEEILQREKPQAVMVYGDTNSTLAGALAASKMHIPIIHVEAGLRSFNKLMPEEINRILTDHVSTLLFCPTKTAVENLANENINAGVNNVGDVMQDATIFAIESTKNQSKYQEKYSHLNRDFALMTMHRAESTSSISAFKSIIAYVKDFADKQNLQIIFPVHPRNKQLIIDSGDLLGSNIVPTDPISYFEIHYLLSKAKYVLTDSGGLQKEAYFHRVPCVTLRSETEWVETISSGWNRLWSQEQYLNRCDINEYGSGNAAEKIVSTIARMF